MEGPELGNLDVPGIDLEPLDPFLDDVFAGLDDHPPGLWHPTLVEGPALQRTLQLPPWDTPAQQNAQQPPAAQALSSSIHMCLTGQHLGEEPQDVPTSPQSLHLEVQQEAHQAPQGGQVGHVLGHAQLGIDNTGLSSFLNISATALNALEQDTKARSNSGTLSQVSAAELLAASSSCSDNEMLFNDSAVATEYTTAAAPGDGSYTSDQSKTVGVQVLDDAEVLAVAASAVSDAHEASTVCAPAADAGSCSSPGSGNDISEGSVPDIDDVSLEQLSSEPAVSHHQQQPCVMPVLSDAEPMHGKQGFTSCDGVHSQRLEQHQLADELDICWSDESGRPATQQLDDGQIVQQPQEYSTLDMPAATPAEFTRTAAGDDTSPGDSGVYASPSSSWHTCMAHGSHMTSNSVMSAASFAAAATAAEVPAIKSCQVPEQLQEQPGAPMDCSGSSNCKEITNRVLASGHLQSQQPAVLSSAGGKAAYSLGAKTAAAAAAANGIQASKEPATLAHPLAEQLDHEQQQGQSQSEHEQTGDSPAEEPQQAPDSQAVWQQQQDELWQDISPPSLCSSPPTPSGYTTIHAMHTQELSAAYCAADPPGGTDAFATVPAALRPGQQRPYQPSFAMNAIANSSYVLRQSELVDLSLSSSVHPSQQQQFRAGWLNAHHYLPPAAALAVERAACALNDSYFFHERLAAQQGHLPHQHPQHHQQQHKSSSGMHGSICSSSTGANHVTAAVGSSNSVPAGSCLSSSGLLNPGLLRNRTSAGQQWSRASTQPQQDQQARHSLPSQGSPATGVWSRPGVLGQWFNNTLQQPLAAAASRAAAGVGQRLMAAGFNAGAGVHHHDRQGSAAAMTSATSGCSNVMGLSPVESTSAGGAESGGAVWCEEVARDAVLVERTPDMPQSIQEQEDTAFQGLLFLGGRDSHSRPVVIVNTDAIPAGQNAAPRDAALAYLLKKLTPIVSKGPYVLVMVSFHAGSQFRLLPGVWCVRAYHSLPRAFRKNVKHVLLLQPSWLVRAGLALLYPFVSSKAHSKIKQVHRLLDIEVATSGEVQVPHLGEAFLTAVQHISKAHQQAAAGHQSVSGSSRTVPVAGAVVN